jgi:hypothetical protein
MVKKDQPRDLDGGILESRDSKESAKMSNQKSRPGGVNSKGSSEIQKLEDQKTLDRIANEAAKQAGATERLYDQSHDIFTK